MTPLPSERDLYMVPLDDLRALVDRSCSVLYDRLEREGAPATYDYGSLLALLAELLESPELPGRDALPAPCPRPRPSG